MPNITTALLQVRLRVRTNQLYLTLPFLLVYFSLLALCLVKHSAWELEYEYLRYWRYLPLIQQTGIPTLSFSVMVFWASRFLITYAWFWLILKCCGMTISSRRLSLLIPVAESVFLIPSWIYIIWVAVFQGELNALPANSFEPIAPFGNIAPIGAFSFDFINSYWVMYNTVILLGFHSEARQKRVGFFFLFLMLNTIGAIAWELGWGFLFGNSE